MLGQTMRRYLPLALVALLLAPALSLRVADAAPLSSRQLRSYVRKARRVERNFKRAAERLIASGQPLTHGLQTRGYEVVHAHGSTLLYKKGTSQLPRADVAVIHEGKVAAVHTHHKRTERGRTTNVTVSLNPGKTLNASTHGANMARALRVYDSALRSNGDAPNSRHVMRSYGWNGRRIIEVTTDVSEHDGNLNRPTSSGKVKDVRPERRVNGMAYLSYPLGKPAGSHPQDQAGQFKNGSDKNNQFQWVKVK